MNIKFTDNSEEVLAAMQEAALRALEKCGLTAEGYAKKLDESTLTEQTFLSAIDEVFKNRAKYAENLKKANVTESAETIGRIINDGCGGLICIIL